MSTPRRILVVRTDRVGDVVLATPLIRALRRAFPAAHLAAMVRPYARDVLAGNPHLDEIVEDDADGAHAGRTGFWRQVRELRRRRFDTALLLLPTKRLVGLLWAAGVRRRIGVGTRLVQVLTGMESVSRRKYRPLRHEADYCLDLGRKIGAAAGGVRRGGDGEVAGSDSAHPDLATEVFLTEEERREGRRRLASAAGEGSAAAAGSRSAPRRFVVIHPGSGRSAPNWAVEDYVALAARLLRDERVAVVVTGGAGERAISAAFERLEAAAPAARPRVLDFVGQLSLRELMGVLAAGDVVVSASTGPMHVAAALRVPTVSLFCPMTACSPRLWGPLGNRAEIVLPPPDYCRTRCPGDPKVCTFEGGILVEDAARRVEDALNFPRAASPDRSSPDAFAGTTSSP